MDRRPHAFLPTDPAPICRMRLPSVSLYEPRSTCWPGEPLHFCLCELVLVETVERFSLPLCIYICCTGAWAASLAERRAPTDITDIAPYCVTEVRLASWVKFSGCPQGFLRNLPTSASSHSCCAFQSKSISCTYLLALTERKKQKGGVCNSFCWIPKVIKCLVLGEPLLFLRLSRVSLPGF